MYQTVTEKKTFYNLKVTTPWIEGFNSIIKKSENIAPCYIWLHYSNFSERCVDNLPEGRQANFRSWPAKTAGNKYLWKILPICTCNFASRSRYLQPPQVFLSASVLQYTWHSKPKNYCWIYHLPLENLNWLPTFGSLRNMQPASASRVDLSYKNLLIILCHK